MLHLHTTLLPALGPEPYCAEDTLTCRTRKGHPLLDLAHETEDGGEWNADPPSPSPPSPPCAPGPPAERRARGKRGRGKRGRGKRGRGKRGRGERGRGERGRGERGRARGRAPGPARVTT
ncbi:hypothetical protein FHS42_007186 [Streptomyces zagrosensis]|uniref:Uncharacterized protein n=1 Tax=Streptomyces zagrosensis TaxID=1042984 RepID=A0A7W9QGZ8_9ACTN|nr:hypothetical protein [Streptomyces zagrosensis]